MQNAPKGILLAGGHGTRLHPVTRAVSKHLLLVYDKPMIYYPLSVLMLSGIREILIISDEFSLPLYQKMFGTGAMFGLTISYAVQAEPRGIAEAYLIANDFLNGSPSLLILGDNIFYGTGLVSILDNMSDKPAGMSVLAYQVSDPENYGIIEMGSENHVHAIKEKPKNTTSNLALTGLYYCDEHAPEYVKSLSTSARGELEIVDLMKVYLAKKSLHVHKLGRGFSWIDAGSFDRLLDAGNFVATVQRRQGLQIANLTEIAQAKGWIQTAHLKNVPDETL